MFHHVHLHLFQTHSKCLSSLAPMEFIVLTSVHHASHLQTFWTQRFFLNNTVKTTERSRFLDSVLFYSAAALTLANNSQSTVTNKPPTPKELQDHMFFLSLRASLIRPILIDNLNEKSKMINICNVCTPVNRHRTCHHAFTCFFKLTLWSPVRSFHDHLWRVQKNW